METQLKVTVEQNPKGIPKVNGCLIHPKVRAVGTAVWERDNFFPIAYGFCDDCFVKVEAQDMVHMKLVEDTITTRLKEELH